MSAFIRRGNPYECSSLRQYGLKCSSVTCCQSCSPSDSHGAVTQLGQSRPDYRRNFLNDLFEVIRSLDETQAETLLQLIRGNATFEQIHCYMDSSLSSMLGQCTDEDSRRELQSIRQRMEIYSRVPSFQPKITDVRSLGESAPYKVPAKPWTTVTDDDALVSYLVSMYFTWDYPFYAFVDRNVLCKHIIAGDTYSDLCSPFLVNALLANACHYSQYSEAYALPGDIRTMGTYFLTEAEQHLRTHQFETGSGIRLASIQATLLLYERYSIAGEDNHGYYMLHRAIEMAEELGIINGPRLNLDQSHMSEDMISSIKRTAWGLFQVDTVVHANFLRPSRVSEVNVEQIDRNENDETDLWTPYPLYREASPSWMSQYFDEACKLSRIARDISRIFRPVQDPGRDMNESKGVLYEDLRRWEEELPEEFALDKRPASHIILLRLRYHALVINLLFDYFGGKPPFYTLQHQPGATIDAGALGTALSSAREISALIRLHRDQYGIVRAHQYVMYTMILALFTMLEQQTFNVLDYDVISLTNAFAVFANLSQVGTDLFRIFRQSVRKRSRKEQTETGEEEKSWESSSLINSPDRWTDYAEALRKLAETDDVEDSSSICAASGIGDMLSMYETLSLGKEDDLKSRQPSSGFRFSPTPQ